MTYYSIDLWDFGQDYNLEAKDKELILSYLRASDLQINDILDNALKRKYVRLYYI